MPETELPHPEFQLSVDAMVAEAVLGALRADPALRNFMTSIEPYELEELLTASTFSSRALAVILDATEERRVGGNHQAVLTTSVALAYVTDSRDRVGTERWLRARLGDHIKRVLATGGGELHWQGRRVSEALLTFRRVSGAAQIGAYLITRFVAVFESNVDEATREYIE